MILSFANGQQNFSLKKYFAKEVINSKEANGKFKGEIKKSNPTRFGIIGIGNLNTESFKGINSAGKFSAYVRPVIFGKDKMNDITVGISFNKNATNNDSLLATTILFPDLGNSSFTGNVDASLFVGSNVDDNTAHYISPFLEFAQKNVKAEKDKTDYYFSLLHYTLGCRYVFRYYFEDENKLENIALSFAPYLSVYNIPDEDNDDYRILIGNNNMPSNFNAVGIKISFQYKGFQVFADFRQVNDKNDKISVRAIKGFNSNIGFAFTTDIIEK
jgi:hypothetical protein